jgi:hypothetical protein
VLGIRVLGQPDKVIQLSLAQLSLLVPLGDLQADEDSGHDDHELDRHGRPILATNGLGESAQDHWSTSIPGLLRGRWLLPVPAR